MKKILYAVFAFIGVVILVPSFILADSYIKEKRYQKKLLAYLNNPTMDPKAYWGTELTCFRAKDPQIDEICFFSDYRLGTGIFGYKDNKLAASFIIAESTNKVYGYSINRIYSFDHDPYTLPGESAERVQDILSRATSDDLVAVNHLVEVFTHRAAFSGIINNREVKGIVRRLNKGLDQFKR